MKRSVRQALADSNIAAISIAVLILAAIDAGFRALWPFVSGAIAYLFKAIAIFDVPYFGTLTVMNRLLLITSGFYLYAASASYIAAWLLSRWVSGAGPFRCLTEHGNKL